MREKGIERERVTYGEEEEEECTKCIIILEFVVPFYLLLKISIISKVLFLATKENI